MKDPDPLLSSASAAAWAALGVQHAILARTMPVVRHDLAGMLTIMRMGAVVLKRRLSDSAAAGEPALAQLEQHDEHLASLAESARRLRHWDLQGPQTPEPLAATAQLARDLARPLLSMRGLDLVLGDALPDTRAPQQPALCLLLGAIHLLAEAPAGAPALVRIEAAPADAPASVRVQVEGHLPDAPPPAPTPGLPPLSVAALAQLAQHVGGRVREVDGALEITAPPAAAQR